MANPNKAKKPTPEEVAALKSEVASFASSLGLAPSHLSSSSGFDDSDFLKSGPLKPPKNPKPQPKTLETKPNPNPNSNPKPQSKSKSHPLQVDPFPPLSQSKSNLPSLSLVKASSLSGQWYVDADELEVKVLGKEGRKKVANVKGVEELKALVAKKKELGERLMEQYTKEYEVARKKSGDMKLLEMTTRSGTSADKVSAFTCLVEDNPIANLRSLDALLAMVTSKVGKRYAFTGFEALKELFLLRLLPDRKLKCLIQRPLDSLQETKDGFSLLLFWHWEELLKQRYERFVVALEEALKDMLPNLKDKAMKTVYILLKSKSEQERRLLSALVNKLGDPERKAASGAGYQLSCLLSAHPNMKAVVIEEVDSFIFRPHIGLRAKYQAVNFLSQFYLSKKGDGPKIAKRLVDVYFALFKVLISEAGDGKKHKDCKYDKQSGKNNKRNGKNESNKKQQIPESHVEMDSRLLSALLTGVNRAFPYVSSDEADDIIEAQTPLLFRLVHSENFNVGVQALMLLYQISSKNQIASDRFYRALYAKLLIPAAVNSSKSEMFLGLLVKAMKNDINLKRVSAFAKRLLQVALQRPPHYACGCLFLLSEVLKAKPPLWTMVLQKESVDDELEHFEDIKEDPEDVGNPPSSNSTNPDEIAVSQRYGNSKLSNHKEDHKYDSDDCLNVGLRANSVNNGKAEKSQVPVEVSALPAGYNPRHREPSYCNADRASWWELTVLASHVHPSVATMARTLLSGANIVYNGDPLNDLSLNAFLDKLMEKKPKPNKKAEGRWHGGSQIAPARKLDMNHHLIGKGILELAEEDVPPEDIVFHRFYMNKTGSSKKPKAKKKKASEDDAAAEELLLAASDESDEEEEIDNMLGTGHIPLAEEGEGEYDYDDLDRVVDEDDDDLLGNESDAETSEPQSNAKEHSGSESDDGVAAADNDDDDGNFDMILGSDDGEDVDVNEPGGSDDSEDDKPTKVKGKKKRKLEVKSRPSPFATLEEYEHLMTDNKESSRKRPNLPKKKKRKTSKV
ncbi:CCAAT/enhancer-binding protein zeta [Asparagus officinalis]|uniref:CCAAT/enhancer-binding protein zeta n=1 Tax=Asparagus officinalis TaxID=4686 RepID=UPI00098E163A|nr:CCAAT/enhancer-binding protein zeta [Asparagus officinalis]